MAVDRTDVDWLIGMARAVVALLADLVIIPRWERLS